MLKVELNGPKGIKRLSISSIKCFKACRREYELKYIEGLEPVEKPDALQVGSNYHEKLEQLNHTGEFDRSDFSKESAMATAYQKYIYPQFKVFDAEKWYEKEIQNSGISLVGRVDGITDSGELVEHKSTGQEITEQYEYNLQWDEQILAYMWLTGAREIWYTVCRKPTIRQKKDESDEEFFNRMVEWYDTDTESKIRLLKLTRTDAEVEQFEKDLVAISGDIAGCGNYYRNTMYCNAWGRRCEYSPVCLHYDPNQQYVEFTRREQTRNENPENE